MGNETVVVEVLTCGMFIPPTPKDAATLGVIRAIERRDGNFAEAVQDLFARNFPDEAEIAALAMPAIVLGNKEKAFVIYVGTYEAMTIREMIDDPTPPPRPRPHDLIIDMCRALYGTITRVVVSEIRDNTFCATLTTQRMDETTPTAIIDSRASDAIIVALLSHLPIEVAKEVFDAVQPLTHNEDGSYTFSMKINFVKEPPAPDPVPSAPPI